MKAIVQEQYGSFGLADLDRPTPRDNELLVRVRAAGVDPGVWHLTAGLPYLVRLGTGLRRPRNPVPGMDVAGVVEAVGKDVSGFAVGDEVFGVCAGAFAEYARARADQCAPKPANLTFEQAAVVAVSGSTALLACDTGRVRAGQEVLVIGAGGGVGSYAVQLARAAGARVTGVCSAAKAELVRSLGAAHVIDYTREDLTGRYDVVVDTAGNRPLARLRRLLTDRGTLVIIGGEGGGRWLGGLGRSARALLLTPFLRHRLRAPISMIRAEHLRRLREAVEAGDLTPVVDRTYPLAEAADAVRHVHGGHATGKVVLIP